MGQQESVFAHYVYSLYINGFRSANLNLYYDTVNKIERVAVYKKGFHFPLLFGAGERDDISVGERAPLL